MVRKVLKINDLTEAIDKEEMLFAIELLHASMDGRLALVERASDQSMTNALFDPSLARSCENILKAFDHDKKKANAIIFRLLAFIDLLNDAEISIYIPHEGTNYDLSDKVIDAICTFEISADDRLNKKHFLDKIQ